MAQLQQQSTPFQTGGLNFSGAAAAGIPQFAENAGAASGIVNNLMTGKPAMDRTAAAYFGVGAGVPGSDFAANRAYDLFGKQREQRQQRGFEDFLAMLKTFSGSVVPTTGEQIQSDQFNRNFRQGDIARRTQPVIPQKEPLEYSRGVSHVGAGGTQIGRPNYSYRYFR